VLISSFLEGLLDRIFSNIRRTPAREMHPHSHLQIPIRPSAEDDPEHPELARSTSVVVAYLLTYLLVYIIYVVPELMFDDDAYNYTFCFPQYFVVLVSNVSYIPKYQMIFE